MKTALILFLSIPVAAQPLFVDPQTKLVTFETIVELDSMPAQKIFDKTKKWFVEYFRNAQEVVRGEVSPEMIKGTFIATYGDSKELESDILVRIKDNKIKVTINRFIDAKENPVINRKMAVEEWAVKNDGTIRPSVSKQFSLLQLGCTAHVDNLVAYFKKKDDW